VEGKRKKPDGTELSWKQLGVLSTLEDASHPFYVEWISQNHPSQDGVPVATISKLNITSNNLKILNSLEIELIEKNSGLNISWMENEKNDQSGILSVEFKVGSKIVCLQ